MGLLFIRYGHVVYEQYIVECYKQSARQDGGRGGGREEPRRGGLKHVMI